MNRLKIDKLLLLVFIINILIRIPRMLGAHGLDGMHVVWEAKLILRGEFFSMGTNLFDILGLYEFSGYPIGSLLFMSFFLLITNNHMMFSIYLYTLIFTIFFVLSIYLLGKELNLASRTNFFFVIFATTIPNLVLFSYYTSSARLPFFALMPFVLIFLLKWNKNNKIRNLLFAILLILFLNFFHRAALILFLMLFVFIFNKILNKFTKKDILSNLFSGTEIQSVNEENIKTDSNSKIKIINYFKERIWVFSIVLLFFISIIILNYLNLGSGWATVSFNIYCYLQLICDSNFLYLLIQPFIDSWFLYGITFFIAIICIIFLLIPKFHKLLLVFNKNSKILILLCSLIPLILVYQIVYTIYYLFLIIALLSGIFVDYILNNYTKYKSLFAFIGSIITFTFILTFHLVVDNLLPYLIIFVGLSLITIIIFVVNFIYNKQNSLKIPFLTKVNSNKINCALFIITISLTSMSIIDKQALFFENHGFLHPYITAEEIEIRDFFQSQEISTFESFDHVLSTNIAAMTGWYFIRDSHSRTVFLLGNRNLNEINITINPINKWSSDFFFNSSDFTQGYIWYIELIYRNCLSPEAIYILQKFNIKYFISQKNSSFIYEFGYKIDSPFINSLYNYVPIVKSTQNLLVWNLSYLYY